MENFQLLNYVSYFFGGMFFTNAIPHFVSGCMGRPFQSPFANPPGKGLSTSTINILWGFFNLLISYLLICRIGLFDLRDTPHVVSLGVGILAMGLLSARLFGRFHGGDATSLANQYVSKDAT